MVTLVLAMKLITAHVQGDMLDEDRGPSYVRYENADVNEVLRTLFHEVNANYAIESGVSGSINLELKGARFSVILNKILGQVHASTPGHHRGMYIIEDTPDHPSESDVLNRKLQGHNFKKVGIDEALATVFDDAHIRYRHPKIDTTYVGSIIPEGTLEESLEVLLPLAKCTANYTHGHFDLLPDSEEKPIREVLDKPVHNIDFINIGATNAFATLFKQSGAEYVLGPNIDRRLTLNLRDAKFGDALDVLCQLTDTTYQLRGTVYQITRRSFE